MCYMEQRAQEQIEGGLYEKDQLLKRIEELSLAIINFSAGNIDETEVKEILCKEPGNLEWCDNCDFCMTGQTIMVPGNAQGKVSFSYCDLGFWKDEI